MEFNKSNRFNNENEKEENPNLIHYKGKIGEFDYDPNIWEICEDGGDYLHFKNMYVENLELPKGLTSCKGMFWGCILPKHFTLDDNFDTSNINNMESMFLECELPKNFSLGDKFDTSKVTNMDNMFGDCKLPEKFTLGDKFNTSSVTTMEGMFADCRLPENFTLGSKFYTSSVRDTSYMFSGCEMPENFTLLDDDDNFNTLNVTDMSGMFEKCKLPENFSLGYKFDTSKVNDMLGMFKECIIPEKFTLGDKFNTSNVEYMKDMFKDCQMSNSFKDKYQDLILESQNKNESRFSQKHMEIKEILNLPSFVFEAIINNWQPLKGDVVIVVEGYTKDDLLSGKCPNIRLSRDVNKAGLIPIPNTTMLIRIIEKYQNCKVYCKQIHPELDGKIFDYFIWNITLKKENGDEVVFENGFEDKLLALENVIFELSKEEYLKTLK